MEENVSSKETENLLDIIKGLIPEEVGFVKAEFEGPDISVYVKNAKIMYENPKSISSIAEIVKKKVIIRNEPSVLMDPNEAEKVIKEIIPEEAVINSIRFVPLFSEVYIEALKPGLVIGKQGSNLTAVVSKTGWVAKVLRMPIISSETVSGVRQLLYNESPFRKKFMQALGKKINLPVGKAEWLKVTALGGFREVGRSSMLLETPHSKIMIDCGISPEPGIRGADANNGEANKAFPYLNNANISINELDAVIVTHAHMDHIGFIPYLFKYGYEGPVYCTPPTRDLMALLLNDYVKLVEKSGGTPLYDEKDIKKMLTHTIIRDYGEVTSVTDEFKLTYHNAGHILGSAIVHLHVGEGAYNIVHTGDIKYGYTRLFDMANTKFPRIDALFIESTYGGQNDIVANRDTAERHLMDTIKKTIENGGKVLIPVFAVGRSQEIQLVLENYLSSKENKLDVPVYLDGMILEANAIHTVYPEYLKGSIESRILSNRSPFESEIFEIAKGNRDSIIEGGPAIILASGGMLNGGVSLEYFRALAENPKNTLIFVGYNSVGS
ncbi:MAG: beta-CASP ribonuclease aCPSF1, partial [Candidatus Micrarchaeaceae archaeon]